MMTNTLRLMLFAATLLLSFRLSAAISYEGAVTNDGNDDKASLTMPGTTQADDLLLVQVTIRNRNGSDGVTTPTGWTEIGVQERDGDVFQSLYYRVATSGDAGSSYTWDFDGNGNRRYILGLTVFRGVDTTTPIADNSAATGMSSSTVSAPSVTTVNTDSMLVGFYTIEAGNQSFTPPSGMTEAYDLEEHNTSNGLTSMTAYQIQAAVGTTGTRNATATRSNDDAIGALVALNPAIVVTTPPDPVAEWRLDEFSWTGASGEVIDQTSNNLHGRAIAVSSQLPSTSGSNPTPPDTCHYGVFDGPNRGFVRIDDPGTNSVLDIQNNLTVTAWIYNHNRPGSGLMTIASKDENWEFHLRSDGIVNWWWGGGSRELNSTAAVPTNTWTHIAIVYASGQQTIYINGAAAGSRNTTGTLTTQNDPVLIGTDLNFNSRTFDGFIDEVRIYNQSLNQAQVTAVKDDSHPCSVSGPDHYNISASDGVACEEIDVTVSAHSDSHSLVDAQGATVTLTTSTGLGTWSGTGITDTTPGDGIATLNFSALASGATNGTVQLSYPAINSSDGNADSDSFTIAASDGSVDNISSGNANSGDTDNPTITVSLAGFRFIDETSGSAVAILPSQVAGVLSSTLIASPSHPAQALFLQAIRTDTETGECAAIYAPGSTVQIGLAAEYRNPTTGTLSLSIAGASISPLADNGGSGISGSYTQVNLTFGADSKAPIALRYDDVGLLQLHAQDTVTLPGGVSTTLTASSNGFVVRPYRLAVTAIDDGTGNNNPGTTSTTAGGNGFIASGAPFRIFVQAQDADGDITPNYGNEISPESITLPATPTLVYPTGSGVVAGTLSNSGAFSASGTSGEFVNTTVRWSEVGTFTVTADVADNDYLGSGPAFAMVTSGNIGRFYPASFNFSGATTSGYGCGSFAYLSEPDIAIGYTLQALNASGGVVTNYDNTDRGYSTDATHMGEVTYYAEDANDGVNRGSRFADGITQTWDNGVYQIAASQAQFNRSATVESPFNSLQLSLAVSDADGAELNAAARDQDPTNSGTNFTAALGSALVLRYGRAIISSTHGPESTALPVIFGTEYWDGNQFVTATDDNCTTIAFDQMQFNSTPVTASPQTVSFTGGTTQGSFLSDGSGAKVTGGTFGLLFSAPGAGNTGSFPVDIDLTNYGWLRFDWNQDGDNENDTSLPQATISFGSYRGHDRVIYWQERFD